MSKPEQYIQYIIKQLESGMTEKSEIFGKFRKFYKRERSVFNEAWKTAKERYSKQQQEINEAKKAEYTKQQLKAYKKGVKDAMQQQKELSDKIDRLVAERESGMTKDWKFNNGKISQFERVMNKLEQAKLDETILKHRDMLNRMTGGYAPLKIDNTHSGDLNINNLSKDKLREFQELQIQLLKSGKY